MTPTTADTVVDFMPPPVPAGEAPMIIKTIKSKSEALESAAIGTVLKPTVVEAVIA
jgi:hypothetical protein